MSRIVTDTVLRAVPRLGGSWDAVELDISVALVRLDSDALPAWWRVSAAVRAEQERPAHPGGPCPSLCLVTVHPSDVDALGRCARELGAALLPGRDASSLRDATGGRPQELVAALARLHGVLDIDPGPDGDLLHVLAGIRTDAADARAAHARVAERVGRMWGA
ncbi:hypothetical protein [Pseudonocardia endophytica]|uniref:Uncharacterized protein n=1 Tax=Pseudonocardia endophytica TaxID=401976 RepID=A0A4R1HVW0_PSEEN|nr:hypothetical protein [Pseudonocardia endophytica]TCK25145.1 hypothetical protein EV378_0943 [Pseudonocardia endophytica]